MLIVTITLILHYGIWSFGPISISLSSHNEESDVDETDSDNSIPALTNRNDSSTDDDASLPRINQRSVSSSSSNDSRGSRLY